MYVIFSPGNSFKPLRVDDTAQAFIIASALVETQGEAIIYNSILNRAYRLTSATDSAEETGELLADPEAMARIEEGSRELGQKQEGRLAA